MTYSNTYSSPSSPTNFNPFSGMGMRKGGRPSLFPGSGDGSTLNLDFTTGVLDSRLTFSRSSTATFVNSSGYVEWAGANTAPYSESLSTGLGYSDNAILSRSTTTSPTGNTAVVFYPTLVLDYHRLQFGAPIAMVGATTISVYVKQIGSDYRAGINATDYIGASVICSLVGDGSVVGAVGGSAPNRAATITKVTDDGWYRITLTGTYNTLSSIYVFMASAASTNSTGLNFVGVASQGIALWGFQVNPGSTAQTYYPTTTAAYYAPRFDYSPTNIGEPRGLLVEGSSINYVTNSSLFSGYNNASMAAVTAGSEPNPEGTANSARQIYATAGGTYHSLYLSVTAGTNTQITVSIWAKARNYTHLFFGDLVSGRSAVRFNLSTGATDNNLGVGFVSAKTTAFPNQWWRCEMVVNVTASTSYGWSFVGVPSDATLGVYGAQYAGTGNAADGIYCYGFSVEAGSGASSYIPTGASQVTRNKDSMTLSDVSALGITNTAGTLVADFTNSTENSNYAANLSFRSAVGSTYASRFRWASNAILTTYFQSDGSTGFTTNLNGSRTSFARCKAATSYSYDGTTTSVFGSMNGAAMSATSTTTQAASIAIPTSLRWNDDGSTPSATDYSSLVMRSVKYYPSFLTIAQMNTLTTL